VLFYGHNQAFVRFGEDGAKKKRRVQNPFESKTSVDKETGLILNPVQVHVGSKPIPVLQGDTVNKRPGEDAPTSKKVAKSFNLFCTYAFDIEDAPHKGCPKLATNDKNVVAV